MEVLMEIATIEGVGHKLFRGLVDGGWGMALSMQQPNILFRPVLQ